ncbi:TRAP transporter substrate-binding protein [Niveibacterium terrae]|uniref:TRAP transporter substrate-binding protein n=1 Tax=Niveibacterium terrae TaxID=3373598 RepID=UPI003A914A9A
MRKLIWIRLAQTLCALTALSGRAFATENLIAADTLSERHVFVQTLQHFGEQVSRESSRELSVTVRAEGVLGDDEQALRAVHDGRVAMTRVNLAHLANRMRIAELLSLPYLFRSEEHLKKVLQGPFGERLDLELEKNGYVRLMYLYGGARNLFCTRPVHGVSDFRGLRVRTLESRVASEMFKALGATPVDLPIGKTAEAFRNHQIDCASDNIETYVAGDYVRQAPYLILDEHARIPDVLLISKKVWDTLTPAQHRVLRSSAANTMQHMLSRWHETEENSLKAARKAGAKVIAHEEIASNAIEEQADRFYNRVVKDEKDLETLMKVVMTR